MQALTAKCAIRLLGAVIALSLFAAACGNDDDSDTAPAPTDAVSQETAASEPTEAAQATAAPEPTAEPTPEPTAAPEPWKIAYLSASSANTFLLASVGEMERLADENNIEMVEFDAQFNADLQTTQLQDAITSGQ